MAKVAILGASRGLGLALFEQLRKLPALELFLSARNGEVLHPRLRITDRFYACDFTKREQRGALLNELKKFEPLTIFYVAGGGPYGEFHTKEMKDHQWAFELNLMFPAEMLHFTLNSMPTVKKMIFVGSGIADSKPDPMSASYCAAKHGLRGLVTSVREEQRQNVDIRLFSPGYIDTDLLPPNAHPRQRGGARSADEVAYELWQFSQTPLD